MFGFSQGWAAKSARLAGAAILFAAVCVTGSAKEPITAFGFVGGVPTGGEDISVTSGTYGTKGAGSRHNNPGARDSATTWKDPRGRLWLFGGHSHLRERYGAFNDVWMFEPKTGAWTWMAGSQETGLDPVIGPEGEFSPEYTPGDLISASSWADKDGNLWLYGGTNPVGALAPSGRMWKFDIHLRQWALIHDEKDVNLGERGVPSPTNHPGKRQWGSTWIDKEGKFWLFGGWGYRGGLAYTPIGIRYYAIGGDLCDLWVFDPSTSLWTWMHGAAASYNDGYFKPIENVKFLEPLRFDAPLGPNPAYREGAQSWTDTDGNFWLFGGRLNLHEQRYYADLWKYTPADNTWTFISGDKKEWTEGYNMEVPRLTRGVYGQQNVFADTNMPGGRDGAATWRTADGMLWMFGGYGAAEGEGQEGSLADVWKFDPTRNQWAWVGGSKLPYELGQYGTQNVTERTNYSGGRHSAATWIDNSGKVWIFGGYGFNIYHENQLNDLWTYRPDRHLWTWVGGNHYPGHLGYYGQPLIPHENNHPGTRQGSNLWAPPGQYLWVFGGEGHALHNDISNLNDLWRYDKTLDRWTWIKGVNMLDHPGEYGPKGEAWHSYTPSARRDAAQWTYGNWLLLFGGQNNDGALNDLWMFDPSINCWMWVTGSKSPNSKGSYGTMGVAAASNEPPARHSAATWLDFNGNLWLYGGADKDGKAYGDLWKFDASQLMWVWMHGTSSLDQAAVYGTKGSASSANFPGSAIDSTAWADKSGNLWLYGGIMRSHLWKYSITANSWTWVSGPDTRGEIGPVYADPGTASSSAHPGSRYGATAWSDASGDLWLFGGQVQANDLRNDLWTYSVNSGQWTFVKGNREPWKVGVYGEQGSFTERNLPGARTNAAAASDAIGNMWLYGGKGYDVRASANRLQGDIWSLRTQHVSAAENWGLYE